MIHRLVLVLILTTSFVLVSQAQTPVITPTPLPNPEIHRWLDVDTLSMATRYRYIDAANGKTLANQQQWQFIAKGRFKFDKKGRYSVVGAMASGNSFTSGWNATGLGTGDLQTNIFPKQLYFDAKPDKRFEFQYGGIAINFGENTEITAYDNDNYLTGERIEFRWPKQVYFDEVSVTYGYVGDLNSPNIFHRFKHLSKSNYHQFLVRKQATKRIGFSADYTFESVSILCDRPFALRRLSCISRTRCCTKIMSASIRVQDSGWRSAARKS